LVFIALPLLILAIDAAVIRSERNQSDAEKAIRLVRESPSRKENFTVQQYIYVTLYHRKSQGEPIEIEGWRAEQSPNPQQEITVEFSYLENGERRAARWYVEVSAKRITPQNDVATSLSWR
jgi:hypothetical protein